MYAFQPDKIPDGYELVPLGLCRREATHYFDQFTNSIAVSYDIKYWSPVLSSYLNLDTILTSNFLAHIRPIRIKDDGKPFSVSFKINKK